jgi:hypothetical protein
VSWSRRESQLVRNRDDRYLSLAFALSRMTADRPGDGDPTDEPQEETHEAGTTREDGDDPASGDGHDDTPESVEDVERHGLDDSEHGHGTGYEEGTGAPLADIEEPHRTTAPQSRFTSRAVTIGLLVLAVGVLIAFAVPVLVAG